MPIKSQNCVPRVHEPAVAKAQNGKHDTIRAVRQAVCVEILALLDRAVRVVEPNNAKEDIC